MTYCAFLPITTILYGRFYQLDFLTAPCIFLGVDLRNTPENVGCAGAIVEIGNLLALGLMRVQARKSSPIFADSKESSLHILPAESGHPVPATRRNADDR